MTVLTTLIFLVSRSQSVEPESIVVESVPDPIFNFVTFTNSDFEGTLVQSFELFGPIYRTTVSRFCHPSACAQTPFALASASKGRVSKVILRPRVLSDINYSKSLIYRFEAPDLREAEKFARCLLLSANTAGSGIRKALASLVNDPVHIWLGSGASLHLPDSASLETLKGKADLGESSTLQDMLAFVSPLYLVSFDVKSDDRIQVVPSSSGPNCRLLFPNSRGVASLVLSKGYDLAIDGFALFGSRVSLSSCREIADSLHPSLLSFVWGVRIQETFSGNLEISRRHGIRNRSLQIILQRGVIEEDSAVSGTFAWRISVVRCRSSNGTDRPGRIQRLKELDDSLVKAGGLTVTEAGRFALSRAHFYDLEILCPTDPRDEPETETIGPTSLQPLINRLPSFRLTDSSIQGRKPLDPLELLLDDLEIDPRCAADNGSGHRMRQEETKDPKKVEESDTEDVLTASRVRTCHLESTRGMPRPDSPHFCVPYSNCRLS